MMFRGTGTFQGGIDLPDRKEATLARAIESAPRPARLLVPLAPCGGAAARPIVEEGARVSAGQTIARAADETGVDILAPLAGRVGPLAEAEIISGGEAARGPAVLIEDVSAPAPLVPLAPLFEWRSADADVLRQRIAAGPLTTSRGRIEPVGGWVERALRKGCRVVIANVVESQPYVTADHRLLAEHGAEVVRGLAILAKAVGARKAMLAVDRRRAGDYRALEEAARACRVVAVAVHPIYPIGNDTILVKVLTGREVPLGGEPLDVRAAVADAGTCLAAYRWVACEAPPLGRVVTVAGEAAGRSGNFHAPFGMECSALAGLPPASGTEQGRDGVPKRDESRLGTPALATPCLLVHGGPMSGRRCTAATVVSPATDGLIAMAPPVPEVAAPCIRCGWCTDHCPARLNVAALNDAYELGRVDRGGPLGAAACVECGVCTYVCPARLPLSQRVKQLKRTLRRMRREMPLFASGRAGR